MSFKAHKLERSSILISYLISITICGLLILLCNSFSFNEKNASSIQLQDFENNPSLQALKKSTIEQTIEIDALDIQKMGLEKTVAAATNIYNKEKQSFENWIIPLRTLNTPEKDVLVTEKLKKVSESFEIVQKWRKELEKKQGEIYAKIQLKLELEARLQIEEDKAMKLYQKQVENFDMSIFKARAIYILPIFIIGIVLFYFRKTKFWPIYFGFTLFSFYAFFFKLLPYLPNYILNVCWLIGVVFLGYYVMKIISTYLNTDKAVFLERKETPYSLNTLHGLSVELEIAEHVNIESIDLKTVEEALNSSFCPSCGNDFIVSPSHYILNDASIEGSSKYITNYCSHCGFEIVKDCSYCNYKNFAHHPFCASCGNKVE